MLPADSYEIPAKDTLLDYSCLTKSTENLEPSEDGKIVFSQPNKIAFNWKGLLNFLIFYSDSYSDQLQLTTLMSLKMAERNES